MDTRVAIVGIIVEDCASTKEVQELLTQYSDYIIGRMGIPYRQKNIRIISVVLDASMDIINALTGKLGRISCVSSKVVYSNV